jgi:hypothetical protein
MQKTSDSLFQTGQSVFARKFIIIPFGQNMKVSSLAFRLFTIIPRSAQIFTKYPYLPVNVCLRYGYSDSPETIWGILIVWKNVRYSDKSWKMRHIRMVFLYVFSFICTMSSFNIECISINSILNL